MNTSTETDLRKASEFAKFLRAERDSVNRKLNAAITSADSDSIIELERAATEIETKIFSAEVRLLKEKIEDAEARRAAAESGRDQLEATELKRAAESYALSVEICDRARREYQAVQAQLFSKDSAVTSARDESNAYHAELKTLVETKLRGNN